LVRSLMPFLFFFLPSIANFTLLSSFPSCPSLSFFRAPDPDGGFCHQDF
jgi:hypothetical protein